MRSVFAVLALAACWSSPPPLPPSNAASVPAARPDDSTLEADLQRLGAFLADKGAPFTAVALVGFTAHNHVVYRTTVCDPDELGGRGAYCAAQVCTDSPDAPCQSVLDVTVSEQSGPVDLPGVTTAIRAAELAMRPASSGHTEATSVVTVATGADLALMAPTWFGGTPWTLDRATVDPDTNERFGFTGTTITTVRRSDDGACLGFAGTTLRGARYESVRGSIRVAFAGRRCR